MLDRWNNVLVVSAHPDDEVIGAGGTLALLSDRHATIHAITLTQGAEGYSNPEDAGRIVGLREQETYESDRILGITHRIVPEPVRPEWLEYQAELVRYCIKLIRQIKPDVIFTHFWKDSHRDHRVVAQVVLDAWRRAVGSLGSLGAPWRTPELLFYETTELFTKPSLIVNVSSTIKRKISALEAHRSQIQSHDAMIWYVQGLAQVRGASVGSLYGEAFKRSDFMPSVL